MTTLRAHALPLALLAGLGLAVAGPTPAPRATVYYVDAGATGGADDGTSWADAYTDLQDALAVAVSGDEVWVAEGTYRPVVPADPTTVTLDERQTSFQPAGGVAVYGGFPAGGGDGTFGARDPDAFETVLSGDLSGDDATAGTAENARHVVYLDGRTTAVTAATRLDGLTVTAGNADGSGIPDNGGGGLFCDAGSSGTCSPTLVGLRIVGNAARNGGGLLVYAQGNGAEARPTLANVTIAENDGVFGGGAYVYGQAGGTAAPVFVNAVIDRNAATTWGGGVFVQGVGASSVAEPTFENATIAGNTANNGGGLRVQTGSGGAATATLDNAVLWGNTATGANPQIGFSNGAATLTAALVEGGCPTGATCVGTVLNADPQFTDAAAGVLTVRLGSPAIDAGDAALLPADTADLDGDGDTGEALPLDAAGNARIQDSNADGTAEVDLGAFESPIQICPGGVCYVDAAATGNGASWDHATPDLQAALSLARTGDEVWVAQGTYTPSASNRNTSFTPPDGVAIYGGFPTGGSAFGARDPDAYETILSGDLNGDDVKTASAWRNQGENAYHVVRLDGAPATTVFDGLTVRAGNANATSVGSRGGGLLCNAACSPTLAGVTFAANAAEHGGGAYVANGSPSFTGVTFSDNTAADYGGAVVVANGAPTFSDVLFEGNTAVAYGGAAAIAEGAPTFTDARFEDNTAVAYGGAAFIGGGTPVFTGATFTGNEVTGTTGASGSGGAVFIVSVSPSFAVAAFADAVFADNAARTGGAVYVNNGAPTFTGARFTGNTATTGGAVYMDSGSPAFAGARFSGNVASNGGAVYVVDGTPSFGSTTFRGNEAASAGAAAYVAGGTPSFAATTFAGNKALGGGARGGAAFVDGGSPTFTNVILWGNTAMGGTALQKQVHRTGGTVTFSAALVESGCPANTTCDGTLLTDNPLFVNGATGDLTLRPGSPAFDAGDASLLPADAADLDGDGDTSEALPLDEAGNARVQDSDGDGTAEVDLGAFESPLSACPGGVCYVDAAATGTGASWADATPDLQVALALARAGDEVWVAEGTYTPHASDRAVSFAPADGVAIYGGFPTGGAAFDARDPAAHETILSGDLNGDDVSNGSGGWTNRGDNVRHVLDLSTGTITAATVFDGLIVTAGNANGSGVAGTGGGLLCNAACSPTISGITFVANKAAHRGGAVYILDGSPSFTNATFSKNVVTGSASDGGAVAIIAGSPSFTNAVFSANKSIQLGGAVHVEDGVPSFTNVTFSANTADHWGGAVGIRGGSPTLVGATFSGNTAARGGAVYISAGSPSFTNAILWGNTAASSTTRQKQVHRYGGTVTLTAALVEGGCPANTTCDGTLLTGDPLFADAAGGDLTLLPGSPAIDAGDASLLPADTADLDGDGDTAEPLPLDAVGVHRVQDGDGDGTAALDLGAFERPLSACPGGVCYVDAAATGDGSSWTAATPDLQVALAIAAAGDAVWVAEGTYTPHASDRAASFAPPEGVAVYGGFPTGGSAFDARDPDAYETVLSGDLLRDDALGGDGAWTNRADNARHVLDLSTGTITAATVLDGLTVAAGHADAASGADSRGGGFSCGASCDPTLADLTFTANHATAGGAIYVSGGAVAVRDATFSGNTATQGGALYVADGSPSFPHSAFSDNTGAEGGAVYVAAGSPSFGRATFSGNQADTGGAIYTTGAPTFASATFSGNRATTGIGGAVFTQSGASSFDGSAFVGNTAATGGGGVFVQDDSPSFANTTFVGNAATRGGAAQVASGSSVSFANAVLWGNTGDQAANRNQVFTVSGATTLTTALVQDGCPLNATCEGALLTADPQFTNATAGDVSLVRGSPAMDAADAALLPLDTADVDGDGDTAEPLPLDAAGAARAQGLALDLGAFEVTPRYDGELMLDAEGWRMLTTPIAGTYDDLLGPWWTQGFENADNPAGACTAYTFDETAQGAFADGWTCLSDQAAPFARASGLMAWVYADDDATTPDSLDGGFPKSFAFTGETSPPPFSAFGLTYTDNGEADGRQGWNLVGNPLGAAIDWDKVEIGAALGESVYVFDPSHNGGDYRLRRKGLGKLEDGVIPAFQGFFVQAYGPGPTLTVPDSAVVDGASPDVLGRRAETEPTALQLDLGVVGPGGAVAPASTAFVSLEAGYALGLDRGDARRLRPTAWPRAVLSTQALGEDQPLAINVLPPDVGPVDLPLEVAAEGWAPGALALRLAASGALPDGWTAVLVDTEAGTETPLTPGDVLDLALNIPAANARGGDVPGLGLDLGAPFGARPPVTDSAAVAARTAGGAPVSTGSRFVLRLTPSATATEAEPVPFGLGLPAPNPSRGAVRLAFGLDAPGPVRLVVYDLLGREVVVLADGDRPAGPHEASLDGHALAPGVYAVRLVHGDRSAVARFTVVR